MECDEGLSIFKRGEDTVVTVPTCGIHFDPVCALYSLTYAVGNLYALVQKYYANGESFDGLSSLKLRACTRS